MESNTHNASLTSLGLTNTTSQSSDPHEADQGPSELAHASHSPMRKPVQPVKLPSKNVHRAEHGVFVGEPRSFAEFQAQSAEKNKNSVWLL